jgi:hypothetical protein
MVARDVGVLVRPDSLEVVPGSRPHIVWSKIPEMP